MHTQFSQAGDADGCLSLQCCTVIVLTHLALNYNLLGKHSMNTATVDDQTLCADTVNDLATVTQELRNESSMRRVHMYTGVRVFVPPTPRSFSQLHEYLIPSSTQICWKKALSLCRREMSELILKHGITTGSSGYDPVAPHICNMKGCLLGHIALLTQAHQLHCALCFPSTLGG
jgi:hypothetical protein